MVTPCNGQCSSPSQTCNTQSNTCQCASGYTSVNGLCQAAVNGPPVWTSDFQLTSGSGVLSIPANSLVVTGSGEQVVRYVKNTAAVNPYYMKVRVEAIATAGSVGLVFRYCRIVLSHNPITFINSLSLQTRPVRNEC